MVTQYYTYDPDTKRLNTVHGPLRTARGFVPTPTAEEWAAIDSDPLKCAYPRGNATPTPPEGKVAVIDGYILQDGAWVPQYSFVDAPPPPPRTFDKYRLVDALMNAGVWDHVEAWLKETPNAWTRALMAPDISEDEPLLAQGIAAVKQLLGWTDEQVEAVLAASAI